MLVHKKYKLRRLTRLTIHCFAFKIIAYKYISGTSAPLQSLCAHCRQPRHLYWIWFWLNSLQVKHVSCAFYGSMFLLSQTFFPFCRPLSWGWHREFGINFLPIGNQNFFIWRRKISGELCFLDSLGQFFPLVIFVISLLTVLSTFFVLFCLVHSFIEVMLLRLYFFLDIVAFGRCNLGNSGILLGVKIWPALVYLLTLLFLAN